MKLCIYIYIYTVYTSFKKTLEMALHCSSCSSGSVETMKRAHRGSESCVSGMSSCLASSL